MDPMHTALLTRIAPIVYEDSVAVGRAFRRRRGRRNGADALPTPEHRS